MCVESLIYAHTPTVTHAHYHPNAHTLRESYVPDKMQNIHISLHLVYDLDSQSANKNSPPFNLTSPKDTTEEVCVCVCERGKDAGLTVG